MIITLKEAYGNDDILKQFPKPDYTHISPKITVSDARWIDFDKIGRFRKCSINDGEIN